MDAKISEDRLYEINLLPTSKWASNQYWINQLKNIDDDSLIYRFSQGRKWSVPLCTFKKTKKKLELKGISFSLWKSRNLYLTDFKTKREDYKFIFSITVMVLEKISFLYVCISKPSQPNPNHPPTHHTPLRNYSHSLWNFKCFIKDGCHSGNSLTACSSQLMFSRSVNFAFQAPSLLGGKWHGHPDF